MSDIAGVVYLNRLFCAIVNCFFARYRQQEVSLYAIAHEECITPHSIRDRIIQSLCTQADAGYRHAPGTTLQHRSEV